MTSFRPHPSVVATDVEDSMVLLHLDTKRYFTLNSTGAFIWKHLAQGKTETEIVSALAEAYDADTERLVAGARRLLDQLEKAALIERA